VQNIELSHKNVHRMPFNDVQHQVNLANCGVDFLTKRNKKMWKSSCFRQSLAL